MTLKSRNIGNILTKFLWVDIGFIALLMVNIVIGSMVGLGETFLTYDGIIAHISGAIVIVYRIIYLYWLYNVHSELREMDETYPITPGGALARVLIPIYNFYGLWNIYSTMAKYFKKETSENEIGKKLADYTPVYYILLLGTSILNSFLGGQPSESTFNFAWFMSYVADAALVVMFILIIKVVSTGLTRLSEQEWISERVEDH
ncbi:hypothetical protein [Salimicrobium halophilum]|uniref:DUF4328 domain-containing protein n=1 Tax=Salimicrobium halophilum TaxID=86666 RepID=A0A1G8QWB6_9BACI|nr:hypothetical protein [Salimicrobium halophilum]SDJ08998.1 hypothetical protein SAMN04490247_0669 [Salimicrobium halophilum]